MKVTLFLKEIIGFGEGDEIQLAGSEFLIGREKRCQIVIDSPKISKKHAVILYTGKGFSIQDLGSSHGTFINGTQIGAEPVALANNDLVCLGGAVEYRYIDPKFVKALKKKGIVLDNKAHEVWVEGNLVTPMLSVAQYNLLAILYEHAGKIIPKEKIVEAVWGDKDQESGTNESISSLARRLRVRLQQSGLESGEEYIESIRGVGLRLNLPLLPAS
jgi:pSer/pThr/pTyr-binding forkhead associated (FHA) protein